MTLVVGFDPDARGHAVLHLGAMFARSADEDLLVCAVVPAQWAPSPAKVDAEYQAYLGDTAQAALQTARERLPDDVRADYLVHHARSAPAGLLDVAEERDAEMILLGSAAHGAHGHVSLGSVASRLLHSAHLPVAVAPRGFRAPGGRVERVTAAFGASEGAADLVLGAARVAARVGAGLRLASFAVRPRAPFTVAVGRQADDTLVAEWVSDMQAAAHAVLDRVEALPQVPPELDATVGRGETWEEAVEDVEWAAGDVLVVGSSAIGPVARVFLGSRSSKIVRHSPVPVVVVPRG
jgi:nucleotide-binding universal stress UspA family protein